MVWLGLRGRGMVNSAIIDVTTKMMEHTVYLQYT